WCRRDCRREINDACGNASVGPGEPPGTLPDFLTLSSPTRHSKNVDVTVGCEAPGSSVPTVSTFELVHWKSSGDRSVNRRTVDSMPKIMVVDDAKSELKLMEGILKSAGLDVVCLPGGERLEERVVEERPDLLLLDIVMPQRNGYEILRSLKRDGRT